MRRNTLLLGLAFIVFLGLSYVENMIFFSILDEVLSNQLIAVSMLFVHNLLVVSLILLGMTLYVNLVLNFFGKNKTDRVVLERPRVFAFVFAVVIVFLSVLRGSNLIYGGIMVDLLPQLLLISTPIGIIEGYGIYLTIKKTLSRTISLRDLIYVYGIFFVAAIMEVAFIDLLIKVVMR